MIATSAFYGQPGELAGRERPTHFSPAPSNGSIWTRYPGEPIGPGLAVFLDAVTGLLWLPSTASGRVFFGVSRRDRATLAPFFIPSLAIGVVRGGTVFVASDGTAFVDQAPVRVNAASSGDAVALRGTFTSAALSSTVGEEVVSLTGRIALTGAAQGGGTWLVGVNLP